VVVDFLYPLSLNDGGEIGELLVQVSGRSSSLSSRREGDGASLVALGRYDEHRATAIVPPVSLSQKMSSATSYCRRTIGGKVFQQVHDEVMEAVHGNPNNTALRALLAQAERTQRC
jgi:hypothetical protein